jgi:hypothetical protein
MGMLIRQGEKESQEDSKGLRVVDVSLLLNDNRERWIDVSGIHLIGKTRRGNGASPPPRAGQHQAVVRRDLSGIRTWDDAGGSNDTSGLWKARVSSSSGFSSS